MEEGEVRIEQGRLPIDLNERTKTSEPTRPPIGEELELKRVLEVKRQ